MFKTMWKFPFKTLLARVVAAVGSGVTAFKTTDPAVRYTLIGVTAATLVLAIWDELEKYFSTNADKEEINRLKKQLSEALDKNQGHPKAIIQHSIYLLHGTLLAVTNKAGNGTKLRCCIQFVDSEEYYRQYTLYAGDPDPTKIDRPFHMAVGIVGKMLYNQDPETRANYFRPGGKRDKAEWLEKEYGLRKALCGKVNLETNSWCAIPIISDKNPGSNKAVIGCVYLDSTDWRFFGTNKEPNLIVKKVCNAFVELLTKRIDDMIIKEQLQVHWKQ